MYQKPNGVVDADFLVVVSSLSVFGTSVVTAGDLGLFSSAGFCVVVLFSLGLGFILPSVTFVSTKKNLFSKFHYEIILI